MGSQCHHFARWVIHRLFAASRDRRPETCLNYSSLQSPCWSLLLHIRFSTSVSKDGAEEASMSAFRSNKTCHIYVSYDTYHVPRFSLHGYVSNTSPASLGWVWENEPACFRWYGTRERESRPTKASKLDEETYGKQNFVPHARQRRLFTLTTYLASRQGPHVCERSRRILNRRPEEVPNRSSSLPWMHEAPLSSVEPTHLWLLRTSG
jgi:hypothetical protein